MKKLLLAVLLLSSASVASAKDAQLKYITVGTDPSAVTFQVEGITVVETNGALEGVSSVTDKANGSIVVTSPDCKTDLKLSGTILVVTDKGECPLPLLLEGEFGGYATSAERSTTASTVNGRTYIKLEKL